MHRSRPGSRCLAVSGMIVATVAVLVGVFLALFAWMRDLGSGPYFGLPRIP